MASVDKTDDPKCSNVEDTQVCDRKVETSDFIRIFGDSLSPEHLVKLKHEVGHCLLYAKNDTQASEICQPRATILMQVRSDGYIGFPGGGIDEGEDVVFSVNRELREEMHIDLSKFSVKPSNHVISHFNEKLGLRQHFYALEVTMDELKNIEISALHARDYGIEVLGTIRVPLHTMGDGYRGFPVFLKHQFIGNARDQLLYTIKHLNLLTEEEINCAIQASRK